MVNQGLYNCRLFPNSGRHGGVILQPRGTLKQQWQCPNLPRIQHDNQTNYWRMQLSLSKKNLVGASSHSASASRKKSLRLTFSLTSWWSAESPWGPIFRHTRNWWWTQTVAEVHLSPWSTGPWFQKHSSSQTFNFQWSRGKGTSLGWPCHSIYL